MLGLACTSQIVILSWMGNIIEIEKIFNIKMMNICSLLLLKYFTLLLFFIIIDKAISKGN